LSAGDRVAAITAILRTAHACGWRVALLRPRGSLAGDADGAPNLVLAHGGAGRVWHVRLRNGAGPLTENEQAWGETLIRAGTVWRSVAIPHDIDQLLADLADSVKPT
jgi:hypothetical protein